MKSTIFTAADEEADIMEWIKDHPELYDKKLTAYKDTASKTCLWTEKSVGLNTECKLLQAWYSSMGTQFNKFTKLKSGYGTPELTEHDKWILCHFDFLRAHITHHRGRQVGGLQAKLAAASTVITPPASEESEEEEDSQKSTLVPGPSSSQDPPPTKTTVKPKSTKKSTKHITDVSPEEG